MPCFQTRHSLSPRQMIECKEFCERLLAKYFEAGRDRIPRIPHDSAHGRACLCSNSVPDSSFRLLFQIEMDETSLIIALTRIECRIWPETQHPNNGTAEKRMKKELTLAKTFPWCFVVTIFLMRSHHLAVRGLNISRVYGDLTSSSDKTHLF